MTEVARNVCLCDRSMYLLIALGRDIVQLGWPERRIAAGYRDSSPYLAMEL